MDRSRWRCRNIDKLKMVIKGLECCSSAEECGKQCPYWDDEGACRTHLEADAIALLKAQEPCEDAVSRKDVINVLQSPCDMRYVNGNWHPCIGDYIEAITNLPAVAPKAQEPMEPKKNDVELAGLRTWDWACPECNCILTYRANYCSCCGRAVKWDG